MEENSGFIVINRKMLEWEWYQDANTFRLFFHLIMKANWKDGRFQGHEVPRGSLIISIGHLAEDLNLSVQNIRTSLEHLKSTGEIKIKTTNKFSLITVINYRLYQDKNSELTNNQQTTNNQLTNNQQTTNNQLTTIEQINKETNKQRNNINNTVSPGGETPASAEPKTKKFVKPTIEELTGYVMATGLPLNFDDVNEFMDYYTSKGWKVGREGMKDWQAALRNWSRRKGEYSRPSNPRPTETVTITDRQKINEEFLNGK